MCSSVDDQEVLASGTDDWPCAGSASGQVGEIVQQSTIVTADQPLRNPARLQWQRAIARWYAYTCPAAERVITCCLPSVLPYSAAARARACLYRSLSCAALFERRCLSRAGCTAKKLTSHALPRPSISLASAGHWPSVSSKSPMPEDAHTSRRNHSTVHNLV